MLSPPTSLREKVAQLVFARLGSNLPPTVTAEADLGRVADLLRRLPLGGLIVFNGHHPDLAQILTTLQKQSAYPLLIGSDLERGAGQQIRGATTFPHAQAFQGIEQAADRVETFARITAREARAAGVHLAFTPVADVHLQPRNPIISTRAFSTDPQQAAELVQAYIRGARAEGLLTTAKHFPGHGRTKTDSHEERPQVQASRVLLERTDLVPFRAAIDAGVDLLMTAHVAFPTLDPMLQPATLSRPILQDLLRQEMGFEGPVITDSLLMGGVRDTAANPGKQAVALLQAGVDVLLDPEDPEAVVEGLMRGVEEGELAPDRIEEAFERVWKVKHIVLQRRGSFMPEPDTEDVGSAAHRHAAEQVARQAISVLEPLDALVPIGPDGRGLLVANVPAPSCVEQQEASIASLLREAWPQATVREVRPDRPEQAEAVRRLAVDAEAVLAILAVAPAAWHTFGLGAGQKALINHLAITRPTLLAVLGGPDVLADVPAESAGRICTYSHVPVSQQALIRFLKQRTG